MIKLKLSSYRNIKKSLDNKLGISYSLLYRNQGGRRRLWAISQYKKVIYVSVGDEYLASDIFIRLDECIRHHEKKLLGNKIKNILGFNPGVEE
jgi:hypothetical protein